MIGEGITEQYYFKHIRSLYNYRYILKPYFFGITSLTDMDRKISEVLEGGGIAICVFDTDVSQRVEAEKKKLNNLLRKYSRKKNVIFCDSMPSVEYWFLLHYQNTNRHFNNSGAVERELRKYLLTFEKSIVFLEKEKWVVDLCADNQLETSIERARNFGDKSPSYSNIYKAFEVFRK
ncbi:MAG: RloB domain-containing protein [Bacteroidales bacterium]|nr:RloB domain-containing protein [Bacteroidales bacterium]